MSLQRTITALAEDFAKAVLAAIHQASVEDIAGVSGGRAKGGASQRGRRATGNGVGNGRTRKRRGRRTSDDLQSTVDRIVAAIQKSGGGMRSEQLQKTLKLSKVDLQRPLQLGLENGALRKTGEKRGTTYFAK